MHVTKEYGGCGSLGLANNPNNTLKPPCTIMVDVNGDRKPTPKNASCPPYAGSNGIDCGKNNVYIVPDPNSKKIGDIFTIMITDKQAIPYGVVAQKAMYEAQK